MALGALIAAYQEDEHGGLRALFPLAGRTLLEYQARCAAAVGAAPIVVLVIWLSRYVSLGSITGSLLAPVVTAVLWAFGLASVPAIAYALASGLLVTAAHADNIGRLRAGTERKIGQKAEVESHGAG